MKDLVVGGVKPFMQLAALVVVLSFTGCASVGVIPLSSKHGADHSGGRIALLGCPGSGSCFTPRIDSHDQLWVR